MPEGMIYEKKNNASHYNEKFNEEFILMGNFSLM